jgi:hypothetical protein
MVALGGGMTDKDYSKEPKTITELRSERSGLASDWTVRDCLVSLLRDIDSGEISPEYCVVIVGNLRPDGGTITTYSHATPNRYIMRGLVEDFKERLILSTIERGE